MFVFVKILSITLFFLFSTWIVHRYSVTLTITLLQLTNQTNAFLQQYTAITPIKKRMFDRIYQKPVHLSKSLQSRLNVIILSFSLLLGNRTYILPRCLRTNICIHFMFSLCMLCIFHFMEFITVKVLYAERQFWCFAISFLLNAKVISSNITSDTPNLFFFSSA
jgi:hypothetical protein